MHSVSTELTWALRSSYKDSGACVRINGAYTDFYISRSFRQESTASPSLFTLFMDSFLHDMKKYEFGLGMNELSVICLLNADDQVILLSLACELQATGIKRNDFLRKMVQHTRVRHSVLEGRWRPRRRASADCAAAGRRGPTLWAGVSVLLVLFVR
ncbi:hypothetical protein EVAR_98334_1 [Eumeta japonica]|uniref:Uncharacterized protein n=1 Tax=Eumeta variegata TaxID=151549 RepID=A0A4C1XDU7_EUMVA|nr:hypothetical protein EVAR_98334_1 [Eumeta japonica]